MLAKLPRRGVPMILFQPQPRGGRLPPARLLSFSYIETLVQKLRTAIGLPKTFTLDACRHGGMTELEEAGLTEGQGRALSAHRTPESYHGYAKRTLERALAATRKRRAHVLANANGTLIQNGQQNATQNGAPERVEVAG